MQIGALNEEISILKMEMERVKSLAESERKESQGKIIFWQEIRVYAGITTLLQNLITFFHLFHIVPYNKRYYTHENWHIKVCYYFTTGLERLLLSSIIPAHILLLFCYVQYLNIDYYN